jgi:hypothetical protein
MNLVCVQLLKTKVVCLAMIRAVSILLAACY